MLLIQEMFSVASPEDSALERTALLLAAYEEASSGGVLITAADGTILSRNQRFLAMWRIEERVIVGQSGWPLLAALRRRLILSCGEDCPLLSPAKFADCEGRLQPWSLHLTDGRLVELTGRSLDGSVDGARGWVWYFRELEREARLAAALRRAEESERRALRSEARLRDAIDTIPGGCVLFDAQQRLVIANEALGQLTGAKVEPVAGTTFKEILEAIWDAGHDHSGLDRTAWLADRYARFETPRPSHEFQRADGRWMLVESRKTAEGGLAAILMDITDLKRRQNDLHAMNEALTSREALLRHLCGNVPGIVVQMRSAADGPISVSFVSDRVWDFYGVSPEAVTADPLLLFRGIHEDDRGAVTKESIDAHGRGDHLRCSFRVVHAVTGAVTWLRGGFAASRQSDGSILWEGVMVDITLLKSREEELSHAVLHAQEASRAKTEFVANMSHELRTPLNAIIGFSEIMMGELFGPLGEPRYVEYAQDVHRSGQHLLTIINSLLDIAKIESGQMELDERGVSLSVLVADCVPFIRERLVAAGLSLDLAVPASLPRLNLDALRMRQVLLNLLSNATKFTESGGHIAVSATQTVDGDIALMIADTGIGMNEAEIAIAIQPFRQVDNRLSRRYEGTGLGLPLSKRLIEMHDGRFIIDSTPGRGTTITLLFPAVRITD